MKEPKRIRKLKESLNNIFYRGKFEIIREIKSSDLNLINTNNRYENYVSDSIFVELLFSYNRIDYYFYCKKDIRDNKLTFYYLNNYKQPTQGDLKEKLQSSNYRKCNDIEMEILVDEIIFLNQLEDEMKEDPFVKDTFNELSNKFGSQIRINPLSINEEIIVYEFLVLDKIFTLRIPKNREGRFIKKPMSHSSYNRGHWTEALNLVITDLKQAPSVVFSLKGFDPKLSMKYAPELYEGNDRGKLIKDKVLIVGVEKEFYYIMKYDKNKFTSMVNNYFELLHSEGILTDQLYENPDYLLETNILGKEDLIRKFNEGMIEISKCKFSELNQSEDLSLDYIIKIIKENEIKILDISKKYLEMKDMILLIGNGNYDNGFKNLCLETYNKSEILTKIFKSKFDEQLLFYMNLSQRYIQKRLESSLENMILKDIIK
jgi:hypothetical protein